MKRWTWAVGVLFGLLMAPAGAFAEVEAIQHVVGESKVTTPPAFVPSFNSTVRLGETSGFQVDREGTEFSPGMTIQNRFRVGLGFDSGIVWDFFKLKMDYEHEWMSGVVYGGETDLEGDFFPGDEGVQENQLRKAFASASLGYFLTLGGGVTTSHWGLGLLANDGSKEWTPGSAYFGASRGGDVVLRGLVATGPYTSEKLTLFFGMDKVESDDVAIEGDEANQWVAGVKVGSRSPYEAGVYMVSREQTAVNGARTDVQVYDAYMGFDSTLADSLEFSVEMEGALITGDTELGPSPEFPVHEMMQMAAATRMSLNSTRWGTVLDFLYASGDVNGDDDAVNNFRVDVNYEMGMMLYRSVLAAQSARTSFYASDLDLVGIPAADLERAATRGVATNSVSIFPRVWIRPVSGLEFYGGPLFAFSEVPQGEGFNTRIAGGDVRNALNGLPGKYYGTEVDLGARWTGLFWGTEVQLGAEGGVFIPGSAFNFSGNSGTKMENVTAWRVISAIHF